MRNKLIDYLLGSLDPAEQELVERELATNEQLKAELLKLKALLESLRAPDPPDDSPADLVADTCRCIDEYENEHRPRPARQVLQVGSPVRRWRSADIVVTAGICVAASMLFFPAIASSRFQAQVTACQRNLMQVACALQAYSDYHNDSFPPVPLDGKLSVAGCYAVALRDCQLLNNPRVVICPSSPLARLPGDWHVPTSREVQSAVGRQLTELQRLMGGSYAYTLGYSEGQHYLPTRNLGRSYFVIMADAPVYDASGVRSMNHGHCGQNVLLEDFHVEFVEGCNTVPDGDAFFVNRYGLRAAGVDVEDAVVGSSDTPARLPKPIIPTCW